MELRNKFFGLVLLGAAVHSSAMTLGRVRGVAVIGRPLDLAVQVQLDPEENASSLCVDADVFHADTRQEGSRVRVTVEPTQQSQSPNIRVVSSAPVDEPMVTIYLRAGCTQKITRRYVLLADYPSDTVVSTAAPSLPVLTAPRVPQQAPADAAAASTDSGSNWNNLADPANKPQVTPPPPKPVSKPAARVVPAVAKPKPVAAEKPAVKPQEAAKPAEPKPAAPAKEATEEKHAAGRTAGQSRLKLDPLVMLAERVASLESSSSVPAVELQRDSQKMESLESSVKALLALAAKNEASMLDMKVRLQKAESERIPSEWVYGLFALLVALLVACLGALAFMWTRMRSNAKGIARDEWWSGSRGAPLAPAGAGAQNASQFASEGVMDPNRTVAVRRKPTGAGELDDPTSEMDVSLVEMSESNFDKLMQSGQSHTALRRGPLPPPVPVPQTQVQPIDSVRAINSEQLFDVRQQAEFFVSLGQTDQAVRILENRISDNGESSPLIYLDLLKIFYTLGLKTDFHQFREDFNLLFNGRVPEFAHFKDEGKGLEEYPHLLAHITALWSRPNVLKVIEASIFRDPLDDKSPPFDLAAFRDLLLLHAIAQTNFNPDAVLSRPMPLTVAPVQTNDSLKTQAGFARVAPAAPAPDSTELDLDLSDLEFSSPSPVVSPAATAAPEAALPPVDDNLLNFDLPDTGSSFPLPKPKN